MDSFELNKIIGAVLGTLLFIMGVGFIAEAIYEPIEGAGPGYALAGQAEGEGEGTGGEAAPPALADIGTLLLTADAAAGQASAKKCQACHDFTSGGPNKTGPNLYDVVERPIGSHEGFSYSAGMIAHKDAGDIWSYDNLNHFLLSPKAFTPGTKMAFAGVKDDAERANIIAYLATLSASPKPYPAPAAPDAAAPPAEGAASSEAAPPADVVAPSSEPVSTESSSAAQ